MHDFAQRSWGAYRVLGHNPTWRVKTLSFDKHSLMGMQRHFNRNEIWTIVEGFGTLTVDGQPYVLCVGDSHKVMRLQWHGFLAGPEGCRVIETWLGEGLSEDDIERKS